MKAYCLQEIICLSSVTSHEGFCSVELVSYFMIILYISMQVYTDFSHIKFFIIKNKIAKSDEISFRI